MFEFPIVERAGEPAPGPARRLNSPCPRHGPGGPRPAAPRSPHAASAPLPSPRPALIPLRSWSLCIPTLGPAAGGIGCVLLGYEDSCSLESSGSSGTRDAEPSDPPTPRPAPADLGTAGGMLLDLAVKRPVVRSKIKVTGTGGPVWRPHVEGGWWGAPGAELSSVSPRRQHPARKPRQSPPRSRMAALGRASQAMYRNLPAPFAFP